MAIKSVSLLEYADDVNIPEENSENILVTKGYVDENMPTAASNAVKDVIEKFEGSVTATNASTVKIVHGLGTKDITVQVYEINNDTYTPVFVSFTFESMGANEPYTINGENKIWDKGDDTTGIYAIQLGFPSNVPDKTYRVVIVAVKKDNI